MSYPASPAAPVRVPPPDHVDPLEPADPHDRTAPYALVRATVLPYPAESSPAAGVRALLARLTALAAEDATLRAALSDDLFTARAGHDEAFHRTVVLPLRRALHNGREPRPALLGRLGTLPDRVPRLADWLALHELRAGLLDELTAAVPHALTAERAALAGLCRSPVFARAIALTSADLLRAVDRAGRGETGRRARKEEASVLRHALRASAKTSPLSWFTAVGWADERAGQRGAAATLAPAPRTVSAAPLTSVVTASRALFTALTAALLDEPRRRRALRHHMTSTARVADGRARFARAEPLFAGGRYMVTREDEVEVAARPALDVLAAVLADRPLDLGTLRVRLAAELGRTPDDPSVAGFVDRLADSGLLVPVDPVDPQHPAPLLALADWLRQWPADAALARRITRLAHDTQKFADTPAAERPALLADLASRWRELLADTARAVPPEAAPLTVLTEDVVAPAPVSPRRPLVPPGMDEDWHTGYEPLTLTDHAALAELTALAELFDLGHIMSRVARDSFVARYGEGGTCRDPWDFGTDTAAAWAAAGRLMGQSADVPELPTGMLELTRLREEFVALARPAAVQAGGMASEIILAAGPVRTLAARLPDWTAARPLSYSHFVQRVPRDGLLCVNHVYGGWGRFTSRFLDALPASAAAAVRERVRRGLGTSARAAQIRPVGGFNANLHPLLLLEEIGPDRDRAALTEADLDLVHDRATDRLRFRVRKTGDPLDVLYLGFLAPIMLPGRLGPFLSDHPAGVVDFRPLLPHHAMAAPGGQAVYTPRLRHRHLVLARRRWHLGPGVLDALRADLAAEEREIPAATVARWRALLDLPDQLFLHPAPLPTAGRAVDDFVARLRAPKPQPLDLGNALHLRCLRTWLSRHPQGVVLEEALPAFGGRDRPARAVESVVETYRPARHRSACRAVHRTSAPPALRRGGTR
ncbi:lantibiotic dehydratase [Streptomyces sp. NPDC086787]|uniref:lantibiotic dehydratase n=1 Tax=Streptomyces sp. NPDC086787 TaxID=3365759 RepID=UPI0037FF3FB2